jgi:DNA-directed RNA polymerase subunit beta
VDIHDVIYVHIDKKKKFPATALLRAFGYGTSKDIYGVFFGTRELDLTRVREGRQELRELSGAIVAETRVLAGRASDPDAPKLKTKKAREALAAAEAELTIKEGDELTPERYERLREAGIDSIRVYASYSTVDLREELDATERGEREEPRVLARDVVDADSGEILAEADQELAPALIKRLRASGIIKVQVFAPSGRVESPLIKNTLAKDPTHDEDEALKQIYSLLRPGDAPNKETARQALERLFFSPKRYDLGRVGRYKINQRLGSRPTRASPCSRARTSSRSCATSSSCTRGAATWTTSTTSATAASARWAS